MEPDFHKLLNFCSRIDAEEIFTIYKTLQGVWQFCVSLI